MIYYRKKHRHMSEAKWWMLFEVVELRRELLGQIFSEFYLLLIKIRFGKKQVKYWQLYIFVNT